MIRDHFRVLQVSLDTGRGKIVKVDGRDSYAGGSGLAALLFERFGHAKRPWNHPEQPLIFAIGPLTGLYPLMSKTVCAFKSPYHDQYAESHAGGRSALSLRFAGLDALVIGPLGFATGPVMGFVKGVSLDIQWVSDHVDYGDAFGTCGEASIWRPHTIYWPVASNREQEAVALAE